MPQLDPTWYASQLFWLVIAFVVLYALVSRVLLPPLTGIIAQRKATITGGIADAERFKAEAEVARLRYEQAMADARERAKALFSDAELSIKNLSDQANQQMDVKLANRMKEADKRIAASKETLKQHFEQAGAALVADIVAKFTGNAPALVEAHKAFADASTKAK